MSISLESALPEPRAARRAFDRATGFDDACFLHDETRNRLLQRLPLFRLEPRVAVDLGCATGRGARALAAAFPAARVLAIDWSAGMLRAARASCAALPAVDVLGGDAERWPVRDGRAGLVLANLVLPWCRPEKVFAEAARALEPGGLLLFATLGPDSLKEIRAAWAEVDRGLHAHALFDMHDLGDLTLAAGLAEPVLDADRLEVTYDGVGKLAADLRACGAQNVAAGRRRTLTGPRRWRSFERALRARRAGERFAVTLELVLGQAWGTGTVRRAGRGAAGEVGVPIERIGRGRRHDRG